MRDRSPFVVAGAGGRLGVDVSVGVVGADRVVGRRLGIRIGLGRLELVGDLATSTMDWWLAMRLRR